MKMNQWTKIEIKKNVRGVKEEKKRIRVKMNFSPGFYINYRCSFSFTFWSSIVDFFFSILSNIEQICHQNRHIRLPIKKKTFEDEKKLDVDNVLSNHFSILCNCNIWIIAYMCMYLFLIHSLFLYGCHISLTFFNWLKN